MTYPFETDIAQWLSSYPDNDNCCRLSLVGPHDFVCEERRREKLRVASLSSGQVPSDAFIWALGEPEQRHVTKIGGLPYRPDDLPWPKMSETGAPMTFMAQICFSGSHDLVGELPGDVLLVFVEDETFGSRDALRFEWHRLGIASPVLPSDLPEPSWDFVTCYGYRCRLTDYIAQAETIEAESYYFAKALALPCTKIGGRPHFLRERDESGYSGGYSHPKGRFIAQIAAIFPSDCTSYSWLNRPESTTGELEQSLTLVDGALIHLYMDEQGGIEWGFEFG